jgi:3-oxoacyl-[acyl-carrier-protein] synthase-1
MGKQDIMFAGGAEEEHWTMSYLFDAMGAMSSKYNDNPEKASRTFDTSRDGFVISGGGSVLVLEDYEHAVQRGAKIYAEIVGYGATSDGHDMVAPSGEGAQRCMEVALAEKNTTNVDYINTHGTSTPVGDSVELEAIKRVFGEGKYGAIPAIASTKSLSGHALGAAGSNEAIYSLIMMNKGFLTPSINIDELDPAAEGLPILLKKEKRVITSAMSNSFGFGGVNASILFSKEDL